jgi:hypothetical protein
MRAVSTLKVPGTNSDGRALLSPWLAM